MYREICTSVNGQFTEGWITFHCHIYIYCLSQSWPGPVTLHSRLINGCYIIPILPFKPNAILSSHLGVILCVWGEPLWTCWHPCHWSVLDIDHWWISNKSVLLCLPPLYPILPQVCFYFHHISDTPPFLPVPLVSSFIPAFPVSLISIPMSPWSSHLSHIVSLPCSCLPLFHTSAFHS